MAREVSATQVKSGEATALSPPEGRALAPQEKDRLCRTIAAVPSDARTGLEIGFSDFRLTELLCQRVDLVSIDLPRPVDRVTRKLAFSGIDRLPFRDGAFDIVVCTEVLEHLSDNILQAGTRELLRVARKYMLLSVPYRQRVWNELFKCAHCGHVCN